MLTLFVIITWNYFGFHMILMLAGLQGVPREIEEAARMTGPAGRRAFRYVTLPLLGPTLRVSIFLWVIGALQLFDIVWVMTDSGPLNASTTMAVEHVQGSLCQSGRMATAVRSPCSSSCARWPSPCSISDSCSVVTSTAP